MKKQNIALILALSIGLTACANQNQTKTNDKDTSSQENQSVQAEDSTNVEDNNTEENESKTVVYASFYPIYNLTKQIAGDKMDVKSFTNLKTESHGWEPSAKDMANLSNSNLMFINGAGMEEWEDSIKNSSGIKLVDTSQDVDLVEASAHNESHDHHHNHEEDDHHGYHHHHNYEEDDHYGYHHNGHHHGMYDPHIWLSPINAKSQAKTIADKLSDLDPDNKDYYMDNYKKIDEELDAMIDEYKEKFDQVENKNFMVTHAAFSYLARDFNLNQMALTDLASTGEVNPDALKNAINDAKDSNIDTIFYEMGGSDKQAQILADEINGKAEPLNTMEFATDEDLDKDTSYQDLVRANLEALYQSMVR